MKNLILLEHFTAQSVINHNQDKDILREALNIANTIIKNFIKNPDIKKLFVIRNEKLKKIISNKVIFLSTNQFTSYQNILKQFQKNDEIILVAPEIEKISINLYEKLKKRFNILCSTYCTVKTFSSKINSLVALKKNKLPVVDFAQTNSLPYKKIIVKPIYGAGSHEVFLIENKRRIIKKRSIIFQRFYDGLKGSFLMLCKNGLTKVLCCNKQIIRIEKGKIIQIGCIIGGLENHRREIEILAKKICDKFKGLFGIIGVDIVNYNNKWLILEINPRFTSSYCGLNKSYSSKTVKEITRFYINKRLNDFKPKLLKSEKYIF